MYDSTRVGLEPNAFTILIDIGAFSTLPPYAALLLKNYLSGNNNKFIIMACSPCTIYGQTIHYKFKKAIYL